GGFAKWVKENWAVSINMRAWALNTFLICGSYNNIYELKKQREKETKEVRKTKISIEQALEKTLKDWYKLRVCFDRSFEDGEKFKYGTLDLGGLGRNKFGEYCVVLKRQQLDKYSSLAFVKEDSLKYVENDRLNIDKLSQDVADRESVHLLATLKHRGDVEKTPTHDYSSMACCRGNEIEAITRDDIASTHIEKVRIRKKDHDLYFDYLLKDFTNDISEMERYQLSAILGIRKLLEERKIGFEVKDEDEN
ncbi:hypothetical protein MUP77_00455, partial [Candidatus Bathyarchaeota archaeon]|nr:hypothetical protein [Candidatus Bathyarchaeota archaeon]